ncbi:NOP protein chaperone 1 isoform X2 [Trachinotus anak]|uniref:NOP protein chaperone 1 isoform X2 n=1 Tax=Trachinotus anak TaxID=443729 RepID=UPI0039F1E943
MELNSGKGSSPALLSCGDGAGFSEKLLLKPRAGRPPQTERVPRSSVLERLQNFLPQMAEANEKLKLQMEGAPAGRFDIEDVEEAQRVIEMFDGCGLTLLLPRVTFTDCSIVLISTTTVEPTHKMP